MDTRTYRIYLNQGLLLSQATVVIPLYLQTHDWKTIREKVVKENLFQANTQASSKRYAAFLVSRLENLTENEFRYFLTASEAEQRYLLWVAVCRYCQFAANFSIKVVRENFLTLNPKVTLKDFDVFVRKEALWHEELENISEGSLEKSRTEVFRTIREARILNKDNTIQPAFFSKSFAKLIAETDASELLYFPISEQDIKRLLV